eukprot:TRINITY_DN25624_c0_g1_i1.p1 TRINITY_DN25624_c0_g1~~TRINITY_DN25624_c0_g1_i1.p1  ORF type:complete len:169 (+),score=16.22 TRINITY_DN25624_c0_g1_i1:73-579(+)
MIRIMRKRNGIRRWCSAKSSDIQQQDEPQEIKRPDVNSEGLRNPPKINPMVKKAGVQPLVMPPEVELSPADEWQPPRLRTEQPLTSFKYQYRGGYKLLFDCVRLPIVVGLLISFLIYLKPRFMNYVYGPVDPNITKYWSDFDDKRPSWPPRIKTEIGRPVGIQQEYKF